MTFLQLFLELRLSSPDFFKIRPNFISRRSRVNA